MVGETLNIESIFTVPFWIANGEESASVGINWSTIIFIAGMMVMVEGMAEAGFFQWLCLRLAKMVRYRASAIFVVFMILSAVLSMFIDSITVILFLAAVTVELSRLLKFDPVPMILAEIFCSNLGGSATMCGDPPNIIIGTSLHLSFIDFLTNTGLIAGISLIAVILYFWFCFGKQYKKADLQNVDPATLPEPKSAIKDTTGFITSMLIFLCAVVMLITHAQSGLTVAFIGTFIALVTLICNHKKASKLLKRIDYHTLLFFIGLFMVVGGLEETGVLDVIANFIAEVSGGNIILVIVIILWVSAAASAFVDNIPFSATMLPVITALSQSQGIPINTLAWTLSIGTDIGGSATPIGASANVVGTAVAMKNGHPVGWKQYCKSAVPATVIVLGIATAVIIIRYVVLGG
jgi:Na+/H+ antiporter NhaD/arsenite permease-like protein